MTDVIPAGYKRTEVGVIPEDWEVKALSAVSSMKSGEGITASRIDEYSQYPCYGGNGLRGFTSRYTHDGSFALIGRQGALCGNVVGVTGKIFASEHAVVVTPRHDADIQFLTYVLGEMRLNRLSEASAQPGLSVSKILQLSIPIPTSKSEQRAIATALSDMDALLAALDQLLAKKRDLKQAAMQQLLTGQTRLPGFEGEWEVKRLEELGEVTGAGVDKKVRPGEQTVRLVNYMDAYKRDFITSDDLWHEVSAGPDQARRCAVEVGDVFFTPTSEVRDDIGHSAVAVEDIPDAAYSYHLVRLRIRVPWDVRFRAYAFKTKHFTDQATMLCEGSGTRYVITLPKFRSMTVCIPSDPAEQTAIAAVLSDMDAELAALEQRRDKTRALKQGMMQELLTGRTRLL